MTAVLSAASAFTLFGGKDKLPLRSNHWTCLMIGASRASKGRPSHPRYLPLLAVLLVAACSFLGLVVLEGLVRVFLPHIAFVGESASLREPAKFGTSQGYRAKASGVSWGATIATDELGFRHDPDRRPVPPGTTSSIVIVGDSVPNGIGVQAPLTFSSLLGRHSHKRIINTSLTGYSVDDYENIIRHFVVPRRSELRIEKVILFVTLNDLVVPIEEGTPQPDQHVSAPKAWHVRLAERINQQFEFNTYLMQKSKLYLLLKGLAYDASKAWFLADLALFHNSSRVQQFAARLAGIREALQAVNVPLLIAIIPYEYQLRVPNEATLFPQLVLRNILTSGNFDFTDLTDYFRQRMKTNGLRSSHFFLFNDHCHLSPMGHAAVADALRGQFQ
jgi:hypothetical protein